MDTQQTNAITGSASAPSIGQAEHPYTDVVHITVLKKFSGRKTLNELIGDTLPGTGRIYLNKIEVNLHTTEAGQGCQIGLAPQGSSVPIQVLATKGNGYIHISNAYTYGSQATKVLIPEDTLSTQIKPVPSDRPTLEMSIAIVGDPVLMISLYVHVDGMRQHYVNLN
jgi:hypothetical protein